MAAPFARAGARRETRDGSIASSALNAVKNTHNAASTAGNAPLPAMRASPAQATASNATAHNNAIRWRRADNIKSGAIATADAASTGA